MKSFIKFISLLLAALFAFGAISCNESIEGDVETISDAISEEKPTQKKTEKKTEKATRPIRDTETPTKLDNTEGLDLNLKILTQNVRYADDPNNNSVQERKSRFGALVNEYKPDLIGTQEVTLEWYEYLSSMENYEVVGESKTGSTSDDPDWNLVIYNKNRFVLMDSDTFWLTGTPDVVSKVEGASVVRICTWAELFDKYTGETILWLIHI